MGKRIKAFLFSNQTVGQTIAKNTFWLTTGTFFGRIMRALFLIVVARQLGTADWGAFSYIFSLASLFTVFIDFGINAIITRESSKDPSVQEKYFATALAIKTAALAAVAIVVLGILPHVIGHPEVLPLIPIMLLIIIFDGLRDFGYLMTRAWERMELEAFVHLFTNVMIVVFGSLALYMSKTSHSVAIGYAIGAGLGLIPAFYPIRRYFKNVRKAFSRELIWPIIASSWPYGMLGLMAAILLNTDTIMIGWFNDLADVGLYGAAQRLALFLYMIPGPLAAAFFPSMAKFAKDETRFRNLLERSLTFLALVGIPLTIGSVLLRYEIMSILYGAEYLAASNTFGLMSLAFVPFFFSTILGNAVFAFNQERKLFTYVVLGVSGNVLLNLVFIPAFGIAGSALATAINQTLITFYLASKVKKNVAFSLVPHIKSVVAASALMGVALVLFSFFSPTVYLTLGIALVAYVGGLYLFNDPTLAYILGLARRRAGTHSPDIADISGT